MAPSNETRACRWRASDAEGETKRLHLFFSAGGFGHMPSFLMRGKMVVSVLKAISHLHHAKGSVLTDARTDATVAAHFAEHGAPDVCVLVKYGGTRKGKRSAAAAACKAAGARGTAAQPHSRSCSRYAPRLQARWSSSTASTDTPALTVAS